MSIARAELQLLHSHFKDKEPLPDMPKLSLKYANPILFPNIRKMLIRIMVLPEQSFSALHRIKSFLRTMTQDRLNGLALLNTQYIKCRRN